MKIIAFYGEQGAGKSPIAKSLNLGNSAIRSFANPIKEMAEVFIVKYMSTIEKEEPCINFDFSIRQLYQVIGTEIGRNLNKDIWVICMEMRLQNIKEMGYDFAIVDDLRFQNERDMLARHGASFVHVLPDVSKPQADDHASEVEWKAWKGLDPIIHNLPERREDNLKVINEIINNV